MWSVRRAAASHYLNTTNRWRRLEYVVCQGRQRGAGGFCGGPRGVTVASQACCWLVVKTAQPNPSLKPSPNGGPPGPASRYGVHFLLAGPGVPPLVPS
jgi:hypothetical protein